MEQEIARKARGFYSQALREQDHLSIARESNTELAVAEGMTNIAEAITHSKRNSALLFGGVLGIFGLHQAIGNENFTLLSSIPVNVIGGMVLGETAKVATWLHEKRVINEGTKALQQPLKAIPSDEVKLGEVRDAVRALMQVVPENLVKAGEVSRWIKKNQINGEYRNDPRYDMAIKLNERVAEFHPTDAEDVSVLAFMRAQAEALTEKRSRKSIAGEARRLMLDQAAGQGVVFGLWGSSLYLFGSEFSALTGGADDVATLGLLYLFTPAKKAISSKTAKELYNKVKFWKKEEGSQIPEVIESDVDFIIGE